ncbi:MAG: hypothetical protein WCU80_00245 [Paludibacteraceae bacterium]
MLKKSCKTWGCPNLTYNKSGWCDECEKKHRPVHQKPDERPTAQERGYDYRWREFSKQFLAHHPVCEMCGAPAEVTDHKDITAKVMMDLYGKFDLDESHYQALCRSCNTKKAKQDHEADAEYFDQLGLLSSHSSDGEGRG